MTTKTKTSKPSKAKPTLKAKKTAPAKPAAKAPPKKPQPAAGDEKPKRQGDRVIEMLRRPEGVTIDQLVAEFGIQKHTARALVSVNGRKIGGVKREGMVYRPA